MHSFSIGELLFKLLAVGILVFCNGFFVAAEFALVKVRQSQLEELASKGKQSARVTQRVLQRLDQALSACQLGITLASLALGWVGEPVFSALLAPLWHVLHLEGTEYEQLQQTAAVIVGFSVMTFLHITAGEQAPKWLAIQRPLGVSLTVSRPLLLFERLMYPFIWLLNHSSQLMLELIGIEASGHVESAHSEEELRRILLASFDSSRGKGSQTLREIMLNVFELKERIARDVMCPRRRIVGFSDDWSVDLCIKVARQTRFSRFPIFEGGDPDRVMGVVHIKDLYALAERVRSARDLAQFARPVVYAPEWARLDQLLTRLLEQQAHFCIIVDEYGCTAGLVTLEDVLEELVGEIRDEFDVDEQSPIQQLGKDEWRIDGLCPLHEVSDLLGVKLHDEAVSTIGGYLIAQLGRSPLVGDRVQIDGWECLIEEVTHASIRRIRVRRVQPSSDGRP